MRHPNSDIGGTPWGTPEQHAEICRRYLAGEAAYRIAQSFGVSSTPITRTLRAAGVPKRSQSEATTHYRCDHAFFDQIDNEGKAYWAGFIAADGCIAGKSRPYLVVSLMERDEAHLERLRAALNAEQPVRTRMTSTGSVSNFQVSSRSLCQGLATLGIVPRKTFTLPFPVLSYAVLPHYVRGYVDGDGGFYRSSRGDIFFCVTSNIGFLSGLQSYLESRCVLHHAKIRLRHKNSPRIGYLRYSGRNQVRSIFNLLYTDATIWLPRKRDKIEQHLQIR